MLVEGKWKLSTIGSVASCSGFSDSQFFHGGLPRALAQALNQPVDLDLELAQ